MRLTNTKTLQLHVFNDACSTPPYVVLSHCWAEDEIGFERFTTKSKLSGSGYRKITRCCEHARALKHQWAWIDTCCIDKTSSAEPSEAINSMDDWYRYSVLCIVFLDDLHKDKRLHECRWFQRGWTLQELLAPHRIHFYDAHDRRVCGRADFEQNLAHASGIDISYLKHKRSVYDASIAERMSWAARRRTTRPEDQAYSLLGLFGVNMPLLYGEGARAAFARLQHYIIAQSDDESIFAWSAREQGCGYGFLASSPSKFCNCDDIKRLSTSEGRPPYRLTNCGIEISPVPYSLRDAFEAGLWRRLGMGRLRSEINLPLRCGSEDRNGIEQRVVIRLRYNENTSSWHRIGTRDFSGSARQVTATSRLAPFWASLAGSYAVIYVSEPQADVQDTHKAIMKPGRIKWKIAAVLLMTKFLMGCNVMVLYVLGTTYWTGSGGDTSIRPVYAHIRDELQDLSRSEARSWTVITLTWISSGRGLTFLFMAIAGLWRQQNEENGPLSFWRDARLTGVSRQCGIHPDDSGYLESKPCMDGIPARFPDNLASC